jgi:hypothetical protein
MGQAAAVPGLADPSDLLDLYIGLKLDESPIFQKMKAEGKGSTTPLRDSFLKYLNNELRATGAAARHRAKVSYGIQASFTLCSS